MLVQNLKAGAATDTFCARKHGGNVFQAENKYKLLVKYWYGFDIICDPSRINGIDENNKLK